MNSLIQADIFFFITGVAVIIVASAFIVLTIYIILISRDIRRIVRVVREQTERLSHDVDTFRDEVRTVNGVKGIFSLAKDIFFKKRAKVARTKPRTINGE